MISILPTRIITDASPIGLGSIRKKESCQDLRGHEFIRFFLTFDPTLLAVIFYTPISKNVFWFINYYLLQLKFLWIHQQMTKYRWVMQNILQEISNTISTTNTVSENQWNTSICTFCFHDNLYRKREII